ncbi:MAG TPA: SDR family NAD(P)-dependent oxidoreductase, partial [Acidimicrobiia bacterium]|nr:SDR family NAD(P)-dependent oxidoreductase [Acidimicrobiia bacterium]
MDSDTALPDRVGGPTSLRSLAGIPAVVTGGSRGIGAATARTLAALGAPVAVVYHRNREAADEVVKAIGADGGRAVAVAGDVSVWDDVDRTFRVVEGEIGSPGILVNNAGIHRGGRVQTLDPADWDAVIATDLTGAFLCARRAVPGMIDRQWGRIVNVSSIIGL